MSGKMGALIAAAGCVAFLDGCSSTDDGAASSASAVESAFLAPAAYADLLVVDPSFPWGVTSRHAASGAVLGARWGAHGGPAVTTSGDAANVLRYGVAGGAAASVVSTVPADLPARHFWGFDGFVDLPFAGLAMRAYTTSNAPFAGELLFFDADCTAVRGRAKVNGFYSGIALENGRDGQLVFTALSGLGADPSATSDNGLWSTRLCGGSPGASCAPSTKLFGWNGMSGPVAADADGNVFVAAFVSGGAHSDAIYAATKTQAIAAIAMRPASVVEVDTSGTSSLVAVGKAGSGWVLGKGYDGDVSVPIWAQSYRTVAAELSANGGPLPSALVAATNDVSLSLFSDPVGHLWVAAETNGASTFLELAPR